MTKATRQKTVTLVLTVIYGLAVIWIILFKMSAISEIPYLDRIRRVNLIPFHYDTEMDSHFSEVFENILIFVPLGLYLKMLGKSNLFSILAGFGFSLLLELAQYIFRIGVSDLTDLMMHTLGAVIGVLLYVGLEKLFRNREKLNKVLNIIASAGTAVFLVFTALLLLAN